MGLPLRFLNPANYRSMVRIARISDSLSKHMKKRCAYCDLDLGIGNETPVVEFVEHLADKHPDEIKPEDVENYRKLIKKMTK